MASSYVEVKESSHDANGEQLPFEITTCESNGLDLPAHIDGEPPKDHTYNKDPDGSEEEEEEEEVAMEDSEEVGGKKNKTEEIEPSKASRRSSRNVKHKIIKPRTVVKLPKVPVKKEPAKKVSRKKAPEPEPVKTTESDEEKDSDETPKNDVSNVKTEDAENISPEPVQSKRKSRKRKGTSESSESDAKQIKTPESDSKDTDAIADEEGEEIEEKVEEKSQKLKSLRGKAAQKTKTEAKEEKTKNSVKDEVAEVTSTPKNALVKKMKSKDVGTPDSSLPPGWTRKIVERKSGKTAGLFDIYIYSPDGIKFRSRPDIAAYLARTKSSLRVEDFNFTKKGIDINALKASGEISGAAAPTSTAAVTTKKKKGRPKLAVKEKKSVGAPPKKSAKLLVRLSTPRKNVLLDKQNSGLQKREKKASQSNKSAESKKPSTSGTHAQKRSEGNRKRK